MDLNHIELSPQSVAELYASVLIQSGDNNTIFPNERKEITEKKTIADDNWKSLGNNQKNILVVVSNNVAFHIPDNELTLLTSILNACKFTVADVAIVNLNNHPGVGYRELTNYFSSKYVLLFGVEPASFNLPMSFPHFQVQSYNNCSYLFSPPLSEIEAEREQKRKLWDCLKKIFNI